VSTPLVFKKAQKSQAKLRLSIAGPSGSGKTYTALAIATNLGKRVAVVDTENSSASKYADKFSFDALNLDTFSPETYIQALEAAKQGDYDVVVIDSLSHSWFGKDGAIEQADRAEKRIGNKFAAWRDVTPLYNRMIMSIIQAPFHVIATLRTKTEYVIEENERGKKVPKKVGLQAIAKENSEYEFDVVGEMNQENDLVITKTRCSLLNNQVYKRPGADIAKILQAWLSDGPKAEEASKAEDTSPVNGWLNRIANSGSLPELEMLAVEIRKLDGKSQSLLIEPYKTRKSILQGVQ
jgi:hypothetical protein